MRQTYRTLTLLTVGAAIAACTDETAPTTASPGVGGSDAPFGGLGGTTGTGDANTASPVGSVTGGTTASSGTGGALFTGGAPNTGGVGTGGASNADAAGSGGASWNPSGSGGADTGTPGSGGVGPSAGGSGGASPAAAGTGGNGSGSPGSGGASSGGSSSEGTGSGGANSGGSSTAGTTSGGAGSAVAGSSGASSGAAGEGPVSYALPPPHECSNQFAVQDCVQGDSSSACGGECSNTNGPTAKNACESGKPGVPVQYACPRHMLFSTEMRQAVIDDGYEGAFNYAIVGHDPDPSKLDSGLPNSCCQCYQLVFDVPTYLTASILTPPPPLIVQSANTAASGPTGFDVFMGAGGLGAFNACNADLGLASSQGYSMYTGYPRIGQAFSGGVKPGPDSVNCTDEHNNLSDALIDDPTCQAKIEAACSEITAVSPAVQEDTRLSCIQSNQGASYYHENWNVYAKRVACPTHLMEVTGCKLPPEPGLPEADPSVLTASAAAAAGFSSGYHTTTMQDCCMPTCAWSNNVQVETVDGYNSFYSCLEDGTPVTQ